MTRTEPPQREPAEHHLTRVGLVLALAAAALLRFWALPHGVPYSLGTDEPEVMERAVRMMKTGDFNPHFFDYPSFYMYIQALVATVHFMLGATKGRWAALAQAPTDVFYVWGRAVTAVLGTATVWVLYRAAMRWGARVALLSAVLLAVMPLHVRESHYVLTDVPATFFVALTFLLCLRARERATLWSFAAAGAAAGLAGAMKYNGGLAVLMPLVTCVMTRDARPSRPVVFLWILGAMLGAFLLAAPYTILDLPTFLNQFARLSSDYRAPSLADAPLWQTYLKHLRMALQWPGSIIVIVGFVLGLSRIVTGPERLKWTLLLVFPLAYFRFVSQQSIVFARYLLPMVPFLSVLAATALVWTVDQLRLRRIPPRIRHAATIALTILAVAPPAYTAVEFDAAEARVWTNELAYNWIRQTLPEGTTLRLECSLAIHLPSTYHTSYVKQLRQTPLGTDRAGGVEFLVASSQCYGPYLDAPGQFPVEYADYQRIFGQTREVARFSPSREHPGPELRILKVTP